MTGLGREVGEECYPSVTQLSIAISLSVSLSVFLQCSQEVPLRQTVNQSLKYHDSLAVRELFSDLLFFYTKL